MKKAHLPCLYPNGSCIRIPQTTTADAFKEFLRRPAFGGAFADEQIASGGFAYNLVNLFRLHLPQPWRSAQIETLRAQLFKIGARVRHTARCVRFHLATGWPFQNLFRSAALAVNSS